MHQEDKTGINLVNEMRRKASLLSMPQWLCRVVNDANVSLKEININNKNTPNHYLTRIFMYMMVLIRTTTLHNKVYDTLDR